MSQTVSGAAPAQRRPTTPTDAASVGADSTARGPYADGWQAVLASGLGSPIPLLGKRPAVHGHTGAAGADVVPLRAAMLAREHGRRNLGIRLAPGVVGIDVDQHKRPGLLDALGAALGWTPSGPRATARDDGSGIFLLSVPVDPERRYRPNLDHLGLGEVDVIHHGHRHVTVAGAHPDLGMPYRWLNGTEPAPMPALADLEPVPAHVLAAISADTSPVAGHEAVGPAVAREAVTDDPGVPAFADAPEREQRRRAAYQDAALARLGADVLAVHGWPVGRTDDRGRGWEKVTADAARTIAGFVAAGWAPLGEQEGRAALAAMAPTGGGWTRADVLAKWKAEMAKAPAAPFPRPEEDWLALPEAAAPVEPATSAPGPDEARRAAEAAFWAQRPALQHVHDFARARMASPAAVLGVVLARVVTTVPPHVVLPPTVGGDASLNLFIAAVGPSGSGKGAAEAAAADAVALDPAPETASVGSGEGLAHLYAHREKGEVLRDRDAVLFTIAEVDALTALGARQGATLLPQLRSCWSGERLGFSYADPLKRIPIDAHTYRAGLVLGVQPKRAGALLDDSDGGTPQRFVWAATTDPDIPEQTPPEPEPWGLPAQPWPPASAGRHRLSIPSRAVDEIRAAARARHRGEVDALDGHALLCRLKVAAALCVLDGRRAVTEADWDIARQVMSRSDATRARVRAELDAAREYANVMRGQEEGQRADVAQTAVAGAAVQRMAGKVLARLGKPSGPPTPWSEARRACASRDRAHFDDAVAALVDAGRVRVEETTAGARVLYKMPPRKATP